ncbi:hypothetical protein HH308_15315 [Gordonia sp. TBRC 11910]|uniref:Acetyltransferase n=1 Tax=Gordonia asplenii TaxID=2725283 RepID=A0A848L1V2_9ACTN|nr:hypothetical protein [Gordonia asplenii]NMO02583.1 hypothetical protein [Gordonia asplenii]
MGLTIVRLDLPGFENLPSHTRRCVYWEVDPATVEQSLATPMFADAASTTTAIFESEFDKEAWVSGLLLEWGTCAQLAVESTLQTVVGTAFYAPPARVPRASHFPTSPVSPDAVLLTSITAEAGFAEAAPILLDAVVSDLMQRGVRAIEAFGIIGADDGIAELVTDLCTNCMMDADFLKDSGFDLVAPHPRFPRFRLELDEGLGWKSAVEGALEKLVVEAALELTSRQEKIDALPVG